AEVLERRERLLQTLLDTARLAGTAEKALQQIAAAAIDLFPYAAAAAVYERRNTTLVLRALAGTDATSCEEKIVRDDFVEHALQEGCIALTNDVRLQDAPLPAALPGLPPPRAVLCAPVAIDGAIFGAFVVHVFRPHEFTDEEFRLVTWLSEQGARAVQALRVQTELRDADRRKTEFLATLSHELRNPLAPLGFALELIEAAPERHPTAIAAMRRQFQQLVRLVDDLLDATRLQRNKLQIRPSRIDLVAIVTQVIEALTPDIETSRHSIALDLPPEAVWIHADADRIAQVVTNLLNNAIRYTPPGGKLQVSVSTSGRDAALSVRDSGAGLEPDDLERVFDLFTQVDGSLNSGLGIGLALVRGIVELHGGMVEAKSQGKDRGAEFRVLLPLSEATQVTSVVKAQAPPPIHSSCRILVVDDNVDSADMMGALLQLRGHHVHVVHDAHSAIAAAKAFAPDTALLDIGLPDMDGYELARRLKKDHRKHRLRLIAVTGWGQDQDRKRAQQAGFDAHVTKPADPDALLRIIDGVHAS
ncbi:MAG TPA: ATP-binding protein, partial [Polyangiaceae bacterium]|nr:ATP-binding protein [Polyangiaceae bacterium]